ncbi:hypothetical protein AAFF_G00365020 [Aldrovandia affinis]|uniref:Uncharacterized protein n=1 Tax=Aldrovandia affinis TaxID=143900 RepID=A0AAD7R565_9TELE|nr:hypothetical protein AAFF_G00365020 [Aldrovandia affinis]
MLPAGKKKKKSLMNGCHKLRSVQKNLYPLHAQLTPSLVFLIVDETSDLQNEADHPPGCLPNREISKCLTV